MKNLFFYGTLCHLPLLRAVLGHAPEGIPARLAEHAVYVARGQAFPRIVAQAGAAAQGVLLRDVSAADRAALDYYEGGFDYETRVMQVETAAGPCAAAVYFPIEAGGEIGAPWDLAAWVAEWGAAAVATAPDVMALQDQRPPEEVMRRYRQMLVRGASRVRAAQSAPTTLRRHAHQGDIAVLRQSQPYAQFFSVEEYELRYRKFDGTMSPQINRAGFVSGDAVTVLPYDPIRDCVLLIEQFRVGPFVRGDAQPWLLEAIAGRVDPNETPEQAARREAVEEAGLTVGALEPVAQYYPSPGAKAEYLYSYVALCDLPDDVAGVFGEATEVEDIRGHRISFERLMGLVTSGEVDNAPLLLSAMWLQRERARLRARNVQTEQ